MTQTNKEIAEQLRDIIREGLELSDEEFDVTKVVVDWKNGRMNISVTFGSGLTCNPKRSEALKRLLLGEPPA
jgi:hypothetical protein